MPTTLRNGDILFNNGTTQDSAAATVSSSTSLDGIGSYAVLTMAANNNLAIGGTIAGSSLRYNASLNASDNFHASISTNNPFQGAYIRNASTYNGGGSAVSGTWRRMSGGTTYSVDSYSGNYLWLNSLYVRIS
jgi:hypothetical protein